jgi:hypothetical protein
MATSCVSIAIGQVRRIDRDNIPAGDVVGMRAAYRGLRRPAATVLIDGNIVPKRFPCKARALVGGDGRSALHRRGVDRRQGHSRPPDGEARLAATGAMAGNQIRATARPNTRRPSRSTACARTTRRSFSPIELALQLLNQATELSAPSL